MASVQFLLRRNNFHRNMISGMNSLLENEELVDVTLAVEGKYLKAHKMVLSVCSPYFKELFKSNPCPHPIVFMKDVSYVVLSDLLQFMYQGEVQVSQENFIAFKKTAEALQIKGLTDEDENGSADLESVKTMPLKESVQQIEEYKFVHLPKKQIAAPITTPSRITKHWAQEQTCFNKSFSDPRVTRQNRELFCRNAETTDKEYMQFWEEQRYKREVIFKRVNEIHHNLFTMPREYSLAHCVAEDMRMECGIAVSFRRDFKNINILLNQRQQQGGVAILEDDVRYIYYLVTKRVSNGKPTYDTMWSSLKKMRDHIKDNNVEKLAIPRLGCGRDRLEWDIVKCMIEFLFRDVDVDITVCNLFCY